VWINIVVIDRSIGVKANSSPTGTTATALSSVASVSGAAAAVIVAESMVSRGVGIIVRPEIRAVIAVALVI
jgi:hypothetical protein